MNKVVEHYILLESLGQGQYGKVYKAQNTKTGATVAVKTIPAEKYKDPKLEEFTKNEIEILNRIKNPNIVEFIEMMKAPDMTYLVYEYCSGGTLEDILESKHHLSESECLKIFVQLLNAFKGIYRENILHRDLKPSNILVHGDLVKIADFGFCKKMSSAHEMTSTMVGSPIYMAPEVLKGKPYNIKADIWSLGVVFYELLFGVCPYEEKSLSALISVIDSRPLEFHPEINPISQNTENLLRKMLVQDHTQRIEWSELLEYPLGVSLPASAMNSTSTTSTFSSTSMGGLSLGGTGMGMGMGMGGLRLDLDTVNHYTESTSNKIQSDEKIIKAIVKDRNRAGFVSNVLHSMLELNLFPKSTVVAFMTLKRLHQLLDTLKKDISIESTNSKFKILEKWANFQVTEDYLSFSRYVNEEMDEAETFLNVFRQEISSMLAANPNDSDLKDPVFMIERLNNGLDMKYLHNVLVSYAEDVNNMAKEKASLGNESEATKLFLHANEVLDCDNLDEFFDKTLEGNTLKLNEEPYLLNLKRVTRDRIQDMVSMKLTTSKMRII